MERLQGLIELARSIEVQRQDPQPPVPIVVPPNDDGSEEARTSGLKFDYGAAEGQSFLIVYRDSKGTISKRRITVWGIGAASGGIPCLMARCHERKASRAFRIDRIVEIIDYDGEVHEDVFAFLKDTFGLSSTAIATANDAAEIEEDWKEKLHVFRASAGILAALSLSDGEKHPAEADVAAHFCLALCERKGLMCDGASEQAFRRYFKSLRPDFRSVERLVERLAGETTLNDLVKFIIACKAMIDADGRLPPEEDRMIKDLYRELTGTEMLA